MKCIGAATATPVKLQSKYVDLQVAKARKYQHHVSHKSKLNNRSTAVLCWSQPRPCQRREPGHKGSHNTPPKTMEKHNEQPLFFLFFSFLFFSLSLSHNEQPLFSFFFLSFLLFLSLSGVKPSQYVCTMWRSRVQVQTSATFLEHFNICSTSAKSNKIQ